MLAIRLVSRANLPQYTAIVQRLHTSTVALDSSSSSSSSDSDESSSKKKVKAKPVPSEEQKNEASQETGARLNNLLELMSKRSNVVSKPVDLAIPRRKPMIKPKRYEDKVISAAKDAAAALGGDVKKTESELLRKLLFSENAETTKQTREPTEKASPINLNDLISGMKISRTPSARWNAPPQKFDVKSRVQAMSSKFQAMNVGKTDRRTLQQDGPDRKLARERGNLYDGSKEILNVFFSPNESSEAPPTPPRLATWEALEKKEFKLALSHPPENIFQELIQWTEQGKLWKFPIDNEQGLEEEQSVHFSEHVFMERHLKDWCPKGGPIRHFMELVCVGLSKNPYMKVNEKIQHIEWYREFFASKQDLLKEIGAIEQEIPRAKQVEAQ